MKKLLVILALASAVASNAAAQYVRFLVPLYIPHPVPGAYGSQWQSQFAAHNGSLNRPYIIEWCPGPEACTADLRSDEELVPNETETALPERYPAPANGVAGAVLYLLPEGAPADDASSVAFQLRIADLSRSAITAGTEIPVIRESAFRASTMHLLNIPKDPKFRVALRIFEMNFDRADFAVRAVDQTTNTVLAAARVTTTAPPQPGLRFSPGFTEIGDIAPAAAQGNIRIEVEPLTPGSASWAYVSITNNDSQQITLVTPQ